MDLAQFMDFSLYNIAIQVLSITGIGANLFTFQCKEHKKLLTLKTANEFLFAIQYLLLGAYTGLAMNIIGCVRNILFAKTVEKGKSTKSMQVVFSVIFLAFMAFTWAGMKSALSGVAKVLSTVAYGSSNTTFVRIIIFFTTISWLVYNYLVGCYSGCICEMLTLASIIIGFIRIDIPQFLKKFNASDKVKA